MSNDLNRKTKKQLIALVKALSQGSDSDNNFYREKIQKLKEGHDSQIEEMSLAHASELATLNELMQKASSAIDSLMAAVATTRAMRDEYFSIISYYRRQAVRAHMQTINEGIKKP